MYRGSSGGEIALLIQRLLNRLGIGLDKVQFIITTASMPAGNMKAVNEFFSCLTGKTTPCIFLEGKKEAIPNQYRYSTSISKLLSLGRTTDFKTEEELVNVIVNICKKLFSKDILGSSSLLVAKNELFECMKNYQAIRDMTRFCRDGAKSFSSIATTVFGNEPNAKEALEVLFSVIALSESLKGENVFPAKLQVYLYSSIELDTEKNCYGTVFHLESNLFGVNIAEEAKILLNEKIINIIPTLIKYQSIPEGFSYTIEDAHNRKVTMPQDGFLVRQAAPTIIA